MAAAADALRLLDDWWAAHEEEKEEKYRPAQPRVPAGSPRGGQWVAAVGGGNLPALDASQTMSANDQQVYFTLLDRRYNDPLVPANKAKAQIAADLATRLEDDPDFKQAAELFTRRDFVYAGMDFESAWNDNKRTVMQDNDAYYEGNPSALPGILRESLYDSYGEGGSYTVREGVARYAASLMIAQWAESSGDEHPRSIAMQLAVQKEFGGVGTLGHLKDADIAEAQDLYGGIMPGLQKFVRAQYDATQASFAEKNITKVALYRGMTFTGAGTRASTPPNIEVDGRRHTTDITQQPASSWTYSPEKSMSFASMDYDRTEVKTKVVVADIVPVERIMSTAATGFGCKDEREMVVLAAAPGTTDTARYAAVDADDTTGFVSLEWRVRNLLTPSEGG